MPDPVELARRYDLLLDKIVPFLEEQKKSSIFGTILPVVVSILIGLFSLFASYSIIKYQVSVLQKESVSHSNTFRLVEHEQQNIKIMGIKNGDKICHLEEKVKRLENSVFFTRKQ